MGQGVNNKFAADLQLNYAKPNNFGCLNVAFLKNIDVTASEYFKI